MRPLPLEYARLKRALHDFKPVDPDEGAQCYGWAVGLSTSALGRPAADERAIVLQGDADPGVVEGSGIRPTRASGWVSARVSGLDVTRDVLHKKFFFEEVIVGSLLVLWMCGQLGSDRGGPGVPERWVLGIVSGVSTG